MCDTLCVPVDGTMWFAKNSDRPINEVQAIMGLAGPEARGSSAAVTTQYLTIDDPGSRLPVVLSQPVWLWGAEHTVNAAGVAIGNEKVWTVDDPHAVPPALLGMDLVRLAGERATTADAAVDMITSLLERWGQGGSGEHGTNEPYWSSFLVVDPHGGWVVETSGRTWVAEPVASARALSNRLSLGTGWTRASADVPPGSDWQAWRDPAAPTGIADHRLAATTASCRRLAAGPPEQTEPGTVAGHLVAALRDHGQGPWGEPGSPAATGASPAAPPPGDVGEDWSGVTVCMHVRGYQCTTASMVAELPADPTATIRLWASTGPACCALVLPAAIVRSAGTARPVVPDALGDPVMWQAATTMARRAEACGDPTDASSAITEARRAMGTVESETWEEAEELAAGAATADDWHQAADRWSARARAAARSVIDTHGSSPTGP